jgi:PDZ domain-containing secreted protein/Zn-dependent protease/CBS domain-containing protein
MSKTVSEQPPPPGSAAGRGKPARDEGMMGSSFRILKVRGISIGAHWSWLLVFGLVSWSLSTELFPRTYPDLSRRSYLIMGVAAAAIFFGSIILHELGHAFQALREGMKVGDITLWLFGGVARFEGMFASPGAEFRVAIAGPVVSLVLAIGFFAVSWAGGLLDLPAQIRGVSEYLARINGAVLAFNLVPALPLDGGRVLRSWLWKRQRSFMAATMSAAKAGKLFAYILMTVGIMGFFTSAVTGGVWLVFLGFFILQAAEAEVQYALIRRAFLPYKVRDLMTPAPAVVAPDLAIPRFLDLVGTKGHSTFPVTDDLGRLLGLISMRLVNKQPPAERGSLLIRDVMLPGEDVPVLDPDTPMMDALSALRSGPGRAVVVDQGRVVGILSMADVARSLELEQARAGVAEPGARTAGFAVWVVVALLMALAAGSFYQPPLAVVSPAPAIDITDDITITGVEAQQPNGRYLLLAVALGQTNTLGTLLAVIDPSKDVIPLSAVVPEGISAPEFDRQQSNLFAESQLLAAAAAAQSAGLDVALKGTGAKVVELVPGSPASKVLRQDDVIVAVNGAPLMLASDLRELISTRSPGTRFTLSVERRGRRIDAEVASARLDAQMGAAPGIGVLVETRDFDVDLPFEIEFKDLEVGGPSAGLAYALAIADMLDPEDLAEGRNVAASGTIQADGRVGPVGGLNQKAEAAEDADADILVAPQDEVGSIRSPDVKLHGVDTLQEAITVLEIT